MVVRPRTDADLDACIAMARAVRELDGYPAFMPTDYRTFLAPPDSYGAWVAEDAGDIVGHVALHQRSLAVLIVMADAALHQPVDRLGVVARLLVDPRARRRGVGHLLLDVASADAVARGLRPVLDVATSFHAAIRLYESCGWTRAGEATVRFDDGASLDEFVYLGPSSPPEGFDDYLDAVLIGGREPRAIEIVDSTPLWAQRFETERRRLEAALGATARGIEHVGSTAVPGLAAKPIVDIMITVTDVDDEAGYRDRLEDAGYVLRVREPGHRMFRTPQRDVHIHVWPEGGADERRHLLFRDWLRSHAEDRAEYEHTKRSLAGRYTDMNYYAQAKTAVIESILAKATDEDSR